MAVGSTWFVTGNNGENVVNASANNQGEAWRIAKELTAAMRMLGRYPAYLTSFSRSPLIALPQMS
jgi:hypothetical protein